MNQNEQTATTNWVAVITLYLCGCTLALHIGKLPVALPLLATEFKLSLAQTGNLVAIYSALIAVCGLPIGIVVARLGYVAFAIVGVSLGMVGSFIGLFSSSITFLMLTRLLEGLGWIMAVVALPVIMSSLSAAKDRPVVLGLWSSFMSVGTGLMLLLAPTLHAVGGWRLPWAVAGGLSLIGAMVAVFVCVQQRDNLHNNAKPQSVLLVKQDLYQRASIAAVVCFMCYSFQYVALTAYFPTMLVEDSGMPLSNASYWVALIVFFNGMGNFSAGWLIKFGLKRSHILIGASVLAGFFAMLAFAIQSAVGSIIFALLMTCVSGVIPGTLFSTAGLIASSAAATGVIIGFMLSGAGLGQILGPLALTRVVESTGQWYSGGLLCLAVGVVGAYFARGIKPSSNKLADEH